MNDLIIALVENMLMPVWIKNVNSEYIYVNKEFARIHNKRVEDIIGLNSESLYDANIAKIFKDYLEETIRSKEVLIKEIYLDKEYRQCTLIPLKNNNEEVIAVAGIIAIVTDIGKIKEKDLEIEIQKDLTNKIIDILPGVIFYKDIESKYIYANKACRDFYHKRGIDNIIGKNDFEINPDKGLVEKFKRDDERIIETKMPICNEAIFKDENGSVSYREVVKIPIIDPQGSVTGIVGRSLDVTERRKNQERLKYLSYTDILTGAKNRTYFEELEKRLSKEEYLPLGLIMGDANGLKLVNDTFGHREGDNLLVEMTKVLKESCNTKCEVFRIGGDEFVILIPRASAKYCEEVIKIILKKCKEYKNELFNLSLSLGSAIKYNIDDDIYDILKEAEDKVYRHKLLQKKSIKSSILNSLKIGLGVKSEETEEHGDRVVITAVKVGKKLGLEMSEIDELRIAAGLHDIGKIGIGEEILLKEGPLTDEEYEIMKKHSEKGYRIIKASSELKNVAESVLYHHERWDGTGYPMRLKGEEIPLLARIISVCDSYDVMISERVYKKAMKKEDAIEELKRCSGKQFDPTVVNAFISQI